MKDISEKELKLLLSGNKKAFIKFYKIYAPKLVVHVNSIIKNIDDAKDVVAEVFVKFYDICKSYDPSISHIFTWLCKVCKNEAMDFIDKKNKVSICEFNEKLYGSDSKPNLLLLDLKELMDDDIYNIMCLKHINGYTVDEISKMLNLSSRTIFRKLKDIENIVKKYLEDTRYE